MSIITNAFYWLKCRVLFDFYCTVERLKRPQDVAASLQNGDFSQMKPEIFYLSQARAGYCSKLLKQYIFNAK